MANLTPVHKAADTTNKRNYRNINLLPVVSNLFENIMQDQISVYMETFLIYVVTAKGFDGQYALLSMLVKWRISLDKGGYYWGILLDLSKAFDTINHDLLVAKLYVHGFDKYALRLAKSYLSD